MLTESQNKSYKILQKSLVKALDKWISDVADSDAWADLDSWHGENETKLMAEAAILIMKNSSDSQNYMKEEGL